VTGDRRGALQFTKHSYELVDFRALTYDRMRTLVAQVNAVACFTLVELATDNSFYASREIPGKQLSSPKISENLFKTHRDAKNLSSRDDRIAADDQHLVATSLAGAAHCCNERSSSRVVNPFRSFVGPALEDFPE
jgi:hypothetical protein